MKAAWPRKQLKEICQFRHGATPSKSNPAYWSGTIPWVSPKDMRTPRIIDSEDHISIQAVEDGRADLTPVDSVLIVVRSGILAHTFPIALTGVQVAFNQDMKAIRVDQTLASPEFVFRFLQSQERDVIQRGTKRGATVHSIQSGFIESLEMPVPPFAEQERIVRLLDAAEDLRRLRDQADRRTADLIPAIFHEMFGDPASNPKGWPLTMLANVAEVQSGLTLGERRGQYALKKPYLRVANVQRGFLDLEEVKEIGLTEDEHAKLKLRRGDLLLVEGNGNPQEIGRAAIWDGSISDCVHQNHLIRVRPGDKALLSEFLLSFVNSDSGKRYFFGAGNTTSGLVTISTRIVKQCRIPIPPLPTQQTFAARVAEVRALEAQQAASRRRLDDLFQSLLHRAFRGEL